ncbi:SUMF1/EgtB/PvdO family nonheme iron enzyme, partial [bacterium]|nr:SUMF1/EgtB/PvdO family nonheme iron enzyme [bacterium]
ILFCYDDNSYGTEMIVLKKTKKFTEYISTYEMMNIQYNEFVEIGNYSEEEYWHINDKVVTLEDLAWRYCTKYQWQKPKYWNLDDVPYYKNDPYSHLKITPVIGITWWESLAYIKWIDGEIITRDDWAKIVLKKEKFPKKNFKLIDLEKETSPNFKLANLRFSNGNYNYRSFTKDGYKLTAPIGSFPPIIYKGQKIYDLIGNVFEWTADVVKIIQYPEFTCADRYIIGGSYKSNIEQMTYPIIGLCPLYRTEAIGFRYKIKINN